MMSLRHTYYCMALGRERCEMRQMEATRRPEAERAICRSRSQRHNTHARRPR